MTDLIAALPMYDRPECRAQTDAFWSRLRDRLRAAGIDAPQGLRRDHDLQSLWRDPKLLFAQTCWGPMEQGLAEHVHVVGQPDYSAYEGGAGLLYSSAVVLRRADVAPSGRPQRDGLPAALPGIFPSRGKIVSVAAGGPSATVPAVSGASDIMISPIQVEMPGRTEGGVKAPADGKASLPLDLMRGKRFAYNGPDSMSGLLALSRDLEALSVSLDIFSGSIETGGHRLSALAVAEGRADVCALDCKSWDMIRRYDAFADHLVAVGWTTRRKGLPFICSKAMPEQTVAVLRQVFAQEKSEG